jgi:type II secretory pathway pseudopilin PulG
MEAMAVVVLIGITTAIAIPSISGAVSDSRASETTRSLVVLGRQARSEAVAYGRAHVMRWSATGNGSFTVYRGFVSDCNGNAWPTVFSAPACGAAGSMCVGQLLASDASLGDSEVRIASAEGLANIDICYEPSGRMKFRTGTIGQFIATNTISGGFRFTFTRFEDGSPIGVVRTILVPLGGDVRELR